MLISLLSLVIIPLFVVGTLQNKAPRSNPTRTPVEVWCGGDDDLTRRVCHAVDNQLSASSEFTASDDVPPRTLIVTITENVRWKELGNRTKVYYRVAFTSRDDKKLGSSKGSCWNDNFEECGAQVVEKAKGVARKIRSKN
jgi:hypothetical protein